jgi:hypothetical protein
MYTPGVAELKSVMIAILIRTYFWLGRVCTMVFFEKAAGQSAAAVPVILSVRGFTTVTCNMLRISLYYLFTVL